MNKPHARRAAGEGENFRGPSQAPGYIRVPICSCALTEPPMGKERPKARRLGPSEDPPVLARLMCLSLLAPPDYCTCKHRLGVDCKKTHLRVARSCRRRDRRSGGRHLRPRVRGGHPPVVVALVDVDILDLRAGGRETLVSILRSTGIIAKGGYDSRISSRLP